MRILALLFACVSLASCGSTNEPPPVLAISYSELAPEAAKAIQQAQLNTETAEDWLKLAKFLHAHGLVDQAMQAYDYSLTLRDSSQASYLLAVASAEQGNYVQAIELASKIQTYTPALWRQGFWELDRGNPNQAVILFNAALEINPKSVAAILGKARTQLALGLNNEAVATLEDLVNRGGKHPYVFQLLGKAYQRIGKHESAKSLLRIPSSGPPKFADAWLDEMKSFQRGFAADLNRAIALVDAGNLQRAIDELGKIQRTYPYSPDVQSNIANVQLQLKKPNEALQTIGNALKKSPNYAPLHITSAFALASVGEHEKAMEAAKKALELQPSMLQAASFLGKLALQQQNVPLAVEYFTYAVERGDSDVRTRELYADTLMRTREWEKARKEFAFIVQLDPSRTSSIGGLAIATANAGNRTLAFKILTDSLVSFPNDSNLLRAKTVLENAPTP